MADEADPDKVLAIKNAGPGRLIALVHKGRSGKLKVLKMGKQNRVTPPTTPPTSKP